MIYSPPILQPDWSEVTNHGTWYNSCLYTLACRMLPSNQTFYKQINSQLGEWRGLQFCSSFQSTSLVGQFACKRSYERGVVGFLKTAAR